MPRVKTKTYLDEVISKSNLKKIGKEVDIDTMLGLCYYALGEGLKAQKISLIPQLLNNVEKFLALKEKVEQLEKLRTEATPEQRRIIFSIIGADTDEPEATEATESDDENTLRAHPATWSRRNLGKL